MKGESIADNSAVVARSFLKTSHVGSKMGDLRSLPSFQQNLLRFFFRGRARSVFVDRVSLVFSLTVASVLFQ